LVKDRREYYRKWREANKDKVEEYKRRNRTQRHCKECNVEVGKMKDYCPECLSVRQKEARKRYNDNTVEYRKQRYENRDKEAYNSYMREYQRGTKFREYQNQWAKNNRKQNQFIKTIDFDNIMMKINSRVKI